MRRHNVLFGLCVSYIFCCANWGTRIRSSLTILAQAQIEATKAFEAYEQEKQTTFRTRAGNAQSVDDLDRIEAEFTAWRRQREEITTAFNVLFSSIKTAEATLPLVEQGLKQSKDVELWIQNSLKALDQVRDLLSHLGIVVSGINSPKDIVL
jgi:hypothetical protein